MDKNIPPETCERSEDSGTHGCSMQEDEASASSPPSSYRPQMPGQKWKGERSPVWKKIDEGLAKLAIVEGGRTVQQIADALGVDRIYIARIERAALNKMQPALQQFARDIGLKAEINRTNVNYTTGRVAMGGMMHKGDWI